MKVGVERRAERVDRFEALALEDRAELALDEPHSFDPGLSLEIVRNGRERAVVSIKYVKELGDEVRLRELCEVRALRFVPLSIIAEVGGQPLEIIGQLGHLGVLRD